MVTKDVSRFLVQTRKHYTGARLQQGRVVLDSDFNEEAELRREDRRRALIDMLGPAGSPDQGFSIRNRIVPSTSAFDGLFPGASIPSELFGETTNDAPALAHPVAIRPGSIYVGGLRFDLERNVSILYQRDFLQLRPGSATSTGEEGRLPFITANTPVKYFYYLRAWEQCVSAVEDQEILEVMLRGGDTSVRVRRMRRVEAFLVDSSVGNCDQAWAAFRDDITQNQNAAVDETSFELRSEGRLRITFAGGEAEDACSPCDPVGKRYLGAENQTLRILLTSANTFVWTLDNPRLFRVKVSGFTAGTDLRVELLDQPMEERDWPFANRVVEIIPFGALLDAVDLPGSSDPHYRKIAAEVGVFTRALETYTPATGSFSIDIGGTILDNLESLVHTWPTNHPDSAQLDVGTNDPDVRYFYMRLWHQAPTADEIELPVAAPPVLGTTGIQPEITPGLRGDYWIAGLRPEAPRQVVPFELLDEDGAPPTGPRRFLAPLAFVEIDSTDHVVSADDCRPRIRTLNNRLCTTFTVGDGFHSFGDFLRVQDAIDALPPEGGVVSVRPGVHFAGFSIAQRTGVTVEGCGAATLFELDAGSESAFLQVQGSTNIQLRNFAVHVHHGAIAITGCQGVALSDLDVASGDFGGPNFSFRQGLASSEATLVSISQTKMLSLRDISLRPNRQRGLAIQNQCKDVTIERLTAIGSDQPSQPIPPPMLEVTGTEALTLRDSSFRVAGQPGIRIGRAASNETPPGKIDLTDLVVEATAVLNGNETYTEIQAPIDIDIDATGLDPIRLSSSRISMSGHLSEFAAVSIRGAHVTVEDNHVTAAQGPTGLGVGQLAWGGIHVRGNSLDVVIRNNRIVGGAGHGITLGSVFWTRSGPVPVQRGGPGRGQRFFTGGNLPQVTGILTTAQFGDATYAAQDEGALTNVAISDNTITGFSSSGISALTVLGLPDLDLMEVQRLRIERNVITGNAGAVYAPTTVNQGLFPFPAAYPLLASFLSLVPLPIGGIVLANGRDIEITDNVITNNVPGVSVPGNGVFVLAGDAIAIEGNRIEGNDIRGAARAPSGMRAGIAVILAGTSNFVGSGPAITDFLNQPSDNLDNRGFALRVVNNTVVQPEGRALFAVATGPVSIDGNFLASQGFHGNPFQSTELFAVGDVVYVQNLGAPWETFEFSKILEGGTSEEYATELTPHLSPILLHGGEQPSPRWFIGLGGGILFVNNQVVYDWEIITFPFTGIPLSYFPNALLGVDHTTVSGNQFAVRIEPPDAGGDTTPAFEGVLAPIFGTLLAGGVTLNVELNRFSENIGSTYLSLLANGDILNTTTLNQCTHPVATTVTRATDQRMNNPRNNMVLFERVQDLGVAYSERFKEVLQIFLRLTFRPS